MKPRAAVEVVIRFDRGPAPGRGTEMSLGEFTLSAENIDQLVRVLRRMEGKPGRGRRPGPTPPADVVRAVLNDQFRYGGLVDLRGLVKKIRPTLTTAEVDDRVRHLRHKPRAERIIFLIAEKHDLPEHRVRTIVRGAHRFIRANRDFLTAKT